MKKFIISLIIIVLLIVIVFTGYYGYQGYNAYHESINNTSIEKRVNDLKNKDSYVTLEQISKTYKDQLLQSEDRRFYNHGAVDVIGLARAIFVNITTLSFKEGGSTITQQLAKNLFFDYHRNLTRKFGEVFGAIDLERKYSKDEIFEMYMNITYFGNNCYGIKEASNYYYHKQPIELTKEEAQALVHTIKSPNNYNPKKLGIIKTNDYSSLVYLFLS